mgnify:CR=1 FL=1
MAGQHRCSRQPKGRGVSLCKVVKDPLVHDLGCICVAENMTELAQYQNDCKACEQRSHQDGILPSRTRHAWGSLARCTSLWVLPFTLGLQPLLVMLLLQVGLVAAVVGPGGASTCSIHTQSSTRYTAGSCKGQRQCRHPSSTYRCVGTVCAHSGACMMMFSGE